MPRLTFWLMLIATALLMTPARAAPAPEGTVILQGTVTSGGTVSTTPIVGAQVTIYQAQMGGTLPLAFGVTDQNGRFTLGLSVNPANGILYAIARGAPSQSGAASPIALMTIIGATLPSSITINEMTTIAAAYSMAQLFQNGAILSNPSLPAQVAAGMAANLVSATTGLPSTVIQSPPNANQTNTWQELGTLANILASCVGNPGPACTALFALTPASDGTTPTTTLAAIFNIARNPANNVRALFALGQAAQIYTPYLTAALDGPAAPNAFMRLDAFTLAIKFNATGQVDANGNELCPFSGLGNVAFDTNGYGWIAMNTVQGTIYSANCQVVLKPDASPADGAGGTPTSPLFGGGLLGQGYGIGFDPSGNVWSGNFGWGGVNPTDVNGNPGGSVSEFTRAGQALSPPTGYTSNVFRAQSVVSDAQGNIWVASYGNPNSAAASGVQIFPSGNPNSTFPFYQDANVNAFDIRLDSDGSGWVTYTGSSTTSKFALTKTGLARQFTVPIGTNNDPKGIAVDTKGNAWVAAGNADAIYAFDRNGNSLGVFKGGGIVGPWGDSTDSNDNVWVGNFGPLAPAPTLKFGVSELCGASLTQCPAGAKLGTPITPVTGYTLPSGGDQVLLHNGNPLYYPIVQPSYQPLMRQTAVRTDMAGNLWVMNNWKPDFQIDTTSNPGGDGLVVFLGVAAPVQPVLYSTPSTSPFVTTPSPLVAAVLPASRSIQVGAAGTVFATIINSGSANATSCAITPATSLPLTFHYGTTSAQTNQITGPLDTPVNIPAGGSQSFVIALTPTAAITPTNLALNFACTDIAPAPMITGVNTLLLSASTSATPDIVAIAATATNDGILHIQGSTGTGALAVATVNVGVSGPITAATNTGTATLPLNLTMCQTNPTTGQCLAAPAATVTTTINANATPTFAVFATATGAIPFNPASSRIFVTFMDSGNVVRGETSVAVQTQ